MEQRKETKGRIEYIPSIEVNEIRIKAETAIAAQDGDKVFYTRIMPNCGICEVQNLRVKKITNEYFTAVDEKVGTTHIFQNHDIGVKVFKNKLEAQKIIDSTLAEGKVKKTTREIREEED